MNEPRPKTEEPKEPNAPSVVLDPSTTAVPTKPIVTSKQPKGPNSGGNAPRVATPTVPAPVTTQVKP
jgi:hypothetical protein